MENFGAFEQILEQQLRRLAREVGIELDRAQLNHLTLGLQAWDEDIVRVKANLEALTAEVRRLEHRLIEEGSLNDINHRRIKREISKDPRE